MPMPGVWATTSFGRLSRRTSGTSWPPAGSQRRMDMSGRSAAWRRNARHRRCSWWGDGGWLEPGKIAGVIYREEDGRLAMTEQRALLQDLDSLPYPAYDLFPLEEVYFKNSQALFSEEGMLARRRLDINASYGCSLVCKFCFHLGISGDM